DGWRIPPSGAPEARAPATLAFPLGVDPTASLAQGETSTLGELRERMADGRAAGIDVRDLRFDLHRRLADAASAAVFVLVAASLALGLRGRAGGVAWTIVLVAGFWAVWTFTAALFDQGVVGPIVAAWSTPAVVAALGVALAVRSGAR
ncbi:MAG: LptF/LptG family permease, partial [Trueperaceae bacterium]|nr:LptF/LptG family permease [Trueperaceae bacterium]